MTRPAIFLGLCSLVAAGLAVSPSSVMLAGQIQPSAIREIQTILQEKARRTPAQRKLESHLHLAGQVARGVLSAKQIPALANVTKLLKFDGRQRVHVDIRGTVSKGLLAEIAAMGGTVESSQVQYDAIRAWIPLLKAEVLARRHNVTFIEPADHGDSERAIQRPPREGPGEVARGSTERESAKKTCGRPAAT